MSRCGCVPKPRARRDAVLVDHAQRAEAHVRRVVVVGEREGVAGSSQPWSAWPRSSDRRMSIMMSAQ